MNTVHNAFEIFLQSNSSSLMESSRPAFFDGLFEMFDNDQLAPRDNFENTELFLSACEKLMGHVINYTPELTTKYLNGRVPIEVEAVIVLDYVDLADRRLSSYRENDNQNTSDDTLLLVDQARLMLTSLNDYLRDKYTDRNRGMQRIDYYPWNTND